MDRQTNRAKNIASNDSTKITGLYPSIPSKTIE